MHGVVPGRSCQKLTINTVRKTAKGAAENKEVASPHLEHIESVGWHWMATLKSSLVRSDYFSDGHLKAVQWHILLSGCFAVLQYHGSSACLCAHGCSWRSQNEASPDSSAPDILCGAPFYQQ